MPCVLCLKDINGTYRRIEFASSRAEELDIKTIIDLHFWRQIKNAPEASEFICKPCWNCLSTFHQFYLTIENAHTFLIGLVSEVAECNVKEYEPESEQTISFINQTEIEGAQPAKRKRGRPRRHPLPVNIDTLLPLSEDIDKESRALLEDVLDEIKLNEIKIELPEADLTMKDALDENISLEKLIEIAYSDKPEDSEDNSKETRHLRQRKSKRTIKKIVTNKSKKPTRKNFQKKTKKPTKKSPSHHVEKAKKTEEFDEYLNSHIKLQCNNCNEAPFSDFTKLSTHYRKEHNEVGYIICCGRKYYRRGMLVDHLYTHNNPDYFKCEKCGQVMGERRSLELHMKMHDNKQLGRIYKCEECSKSFYNKVILKRHELIHLPAEDRTVPCPECDKQFPSNYVMKQHYYRTHLNKYAKICDVCGKSIQGREAFDLHMKEHIMGKRLFMNCDICGATLTNKWGLARHIKMMHTEENLKPMKCPICFKISATLQAHQTHIKFSHNTERKHQCPLCDKAFKRPKVLREHMTTHTGDTLYTCPHCPKTFNSNANMHSHRKKKHREEWEANRRHRFIRDGQKSQKTTNSTDNMTTNGIEVNENLKDESLSSVNI